MRKIKSTERGWVGHFCEAQKCRFRRNTLLQSGDIHIVVSTVGAYVVGFQDVEIGIDRYYETRAFHSKTSDVMYHDADFHRPIEIKGQWSLGKEALANDNLANTMHDEVVAELVLRIANGEFDQRKSDAD